MVAVIILAAGSSSRLGKAKQNLVYRSKTLLQRAIETAIASKAATVIVVLGANADIVQPTIQSLPITITHNPDWAEGMASSIRLGINEIQSIATITDSVVLMLCDQPFVDKALIDKLIENQTQKGIIASAYNNTLGAPVLFTANYFEELKQLQGQDGAKKLLLKYPDDVAAIPFPLGSVDVDTIDVFERL